MIIFLYLKSSIITLERNTFFPPSIVEWNKLSREVRNSENIRISKERLLEFTRPSPNSIFEGIVICGGDTESINHFFLHCPEYCEARETLFDNIQSIDKMLLSQNESSLTHFLIYDDPKRNSNVNAFILNSATDFILSSGRFNGPLFNGA